MPGEADRMIAALHAGDEQLGVVVAGLTTEQLTGPSAAAEWDVSQVLSHLGSGAVITLATLQAALDGQPNPGAEANREVWARWDAMDARQRWAEYRTANAELLSRFDSIDAATRESLRVDMGFLPAPVDLATAARFRLSEFTLHSWDVRVVLDSAATLHPDAVSLLLPQVEMMFGWLAKPATVDARVRVELTDPERAFGLVLGETPVLGEEPADPDGVLRAPAEAWVRLTSGRLAAAHTPPAVALSGPADLDVLRAVFPGF